MFDVAPGTITVFSDPHCPWAHLAVYRLLATRRRLGLDGKVVLDHRAFPLEFFNRRPTPKRIVDAEVAVLGGLEYAAGWQVWQEPESTYPVTMLLAHEAIQAAKEQSLAASERLDRGLRVAFLGESRCISMRHVILEVAEKCDVVDAVALEEALDAGRARRMIFEQAAQAEEWNVQGSPHLFLADGYDVHNPGLEWRWEGTKGVGFPVVKSDDPAVYETILRRAADA
jgi:predicted DsbA family dithiol-disulfide isomerase